MATQGGIGKFKWNGPALVAYSERQLKAGLEAVWIEFQRMTRKRASITNTGEVIKLKGKRKRRPTISIGLTAEKDKKGRSVIVRRRGKRFPIYIPGVGWRMSKFIRKHPDSIGNKTQITVYPHSSKPGESVRRRTGIGQKNIVGGRQGLRARVGYSPVARYMTFHEIGIRYPRGGKQKRPTLVPVLRRNHQRLAGLMRRAADRTKP